jgi:hypothetical protein
MGAFDDLVPQEAPASAGAFDDLIPKQAPAARVAGAFDDLIPKQAPHQSVLGAIHEKINPEPIIGGVGASIGRMLHGLATLPERAIKASQQDVQTMGSGEPIQAVDPAAEAAMATLPFRKTVGGVRAHPSEATAVEAPKPVPETPKPAEPPPVEPAGVVPPQITAETMRPAAEPPAPPAKPATPQALADDLQTLRQSSVADRAEVGNTIRALPEAARDPAVGERLYHAAEDPKALAELTPEERALYDEHLAPLRAEQARLAEEARALGGGPELIGDPNYIHRISKGHAPAYDSLSGDAYDPVTGTRGLPRTTAALQERKFFVLEDAAGNRKVVSAGDTPAVWNDKKATPIPDAPEIVPGENVAIGGKEWKVKQATTKEIEQHTSVEYHKNAFVNTADAIVRLREVVRNLKFVQEVKGSAWWLEHAVKADGNRQIPDGWVRPKMPQFAEWYVDPKIAHVLDDFYKPGLLDAGSALRKINQFATSSMFWNPIPHMQNVGVHWAVARGWDWLRPGPWRHFATDMTRAIKAVVTQNKDYQRFLREGGGLVYGGVKNADFYRDIGRHMGMDIEKNWGSWKPLFDKFGLKTPYEAVAWWYGKMREVLWASSDALMMHRYLELERKGHSMRHAMKEAEKHIPNYRIPSEILGSRTASRIAQEPAAVVFARYHYGMWKSFMNMAADLTKGTMAEKKEALGNVAALAAMGFVVYPVIDAIYGKITGDEKAKMLRRGAMSVPHGLSETAKDRQSFSQFLQSNITAAPATKEVLQQFFGKDFFTGKDLGGAVPRVSHASKVFLQPLSTVEQTVAGTGGKKGKRAPRTAGRTILDTIVGGENTSGKTEGGKKYGAKLRAKEEKRHARKPQGLIEQGYYGAKKALMEKMQQYKGPQ